VTGQWLDEAHPHLRNEWRKGKPRIWAHRDFGEIENVLLPLAADGVTVNILLAYTVLYRPDGSVG
jgi:hypothetical protein